MKRIFKLLTVMMISLFIIACGEKKEETKTCLLYTSCILCISTEGDTDKDGYRNVVWNGHYENN